MVGSASSAEVGQKTRAQPSSDEVELQRLISQRKESQAMAGAERATLSERIRKHVRRVRRSQATARIQAALAVFRGAASMPKLKSIKKKKLIAH
eukprot:7021373-Pyramimonas_sp.AAC.1